MLVDHAEAERIGIGRPRDLRLVAIDQKCAGIGPVIAEQAFDQRGLAGAVLAEQTVHRRGQYLERYIVERGEGAEALADPHGLDADRRHGSCATKVSLSATAP